MGRRVSKTPVVVPAGCEAAQGTRTRCRSGSGEVSLGAAGGAITPLTCTQELFVFLIRGSADP